MSKVDMSRRVGVLMTTKAVMALSNDNLQAFIKAVGQAESMTDLNSEFAGVIEAAEKELMAKGYVRDSKGRLLPPDAVAEQSQKEDKRIIVRMSKKSGKTLMAEKGSSKSGNYGHAGIPGHQGGSAPKGKGAITGGGAAAPDVKAQKRDLQKQLADLTNQIAMASGNETARLHREIMATQRQLDKLTGTRSRVDGSQTVRNFQASGRGKPAPAAAPSKAPAQPAGDMKVSFGSVNLPKTGTYVKFEGVERYHKLKTMTDKELENLRDKIERSAGKPIPMDAMQASRHGFPAFTIFENGEETGGG